MPTMLWWFIGVSCAELALAAALLRTRSQETEGWPSGAEPPPQALALLRGGRRAAVTVALVALHQRGAVAAGRKRTVRANGGPGRTRDPVQLGVHGALHRALALRALALRPEARRAVDALRAELGRAGLLRPPTRLRAARVLLACVPLTVGAGLLAAWAHAGYGGASGTGLGGGPGGVGALLAVTVAPVLVAVALLRLPPATRAARQLLAGLRERHPLPAHRREVTDGRLVQLYVALYGDPALALFLPRFSRDGGLLDRPREPDRNRPPPEPGRGAGHPSA
ncbi:TIGR04222 domain-containing membrane protein [Streptomyces sp. NBC_00094]|uniref:TIGR04222 domain-containing membrane protein n=1 Tax=Streptomyces sp. NBC_00094 TaxID=2903620 RepID=UPI0022571DD3|nr:TIGR04222 domain-containing membrane protein [Streptomyces sp. NBC_00094]MCX5394051.1 TIGR04222 domain-containing membrane protein [Streptomyces sp. NBC_00094]